jgi:hypothetical protein
VPGLIDPDRMPGARWVPARRGDGSETPLAFRPCPLADRGPPQVGLTGFENSRRDLHPAGIPGTGRPMRADTENRAAGQGRRGNGSFPDGRIRWPGPLHQAASPSWAVAFARAVLRPRMRRVNRRGQGARACSPRRRQPPLPAAVSRLPGRRTLTAAGGRYRFFRLQGRLSGCPGSAAIGRCARTRACPGSTGLPNGSFPTGVPDPDPVEGLPHAHLLILDIAKGAERGPQRVR